MKTLLIIIVLFVFSNNLDSQLRSSKESKVIYEIFEELNNAYLVLIKTDKENEKYLEVLLYISLKEKEINKLINNQKFMSKVNTGTKKFEQLENTYKLIKQYMRSISQIDINNKKINLFKAGDNLCYYVEDQRGGYINVYLNVIKKESNSFLCIVTGIDNYDPYNSLDQSTKKIYEATLNNVTYKVNGKYQISFDLISFLTKC